MSHVVMQAAEFPTPEAAEAAERELALLFKAYVEFERRDPDPWGRDRLAPPLVEFGRKHGVEWPNEEGAWFLLKDFFEDTAELIWVDRMVFFWGGGHELGGETMREVLRKLGATRVEERCHLVIEHDAPDERIAELAEFLGEEDFGGQFSLDPTEEDFSCFSLKILGPTHQRVLSFDDSGVQDWAFVAILPQLDKEDPRFIEVKA